MVDDVAASARPNDRNGDEDAPAHDSDEWLMLQVQQDDFDAFEQLFERYQSRIYSFYTRLTYDRSLAEDYTQDVFTRLWGARAHYRPTGRFINYVYQIARNHWINENKRRTNRPDDGPLDAVMPFAASEHLDDQPLATLLRTELAQMIEQALQEIPDEQREVFVLSRFEQLRYQDIAEIVGVPVRTVESRLVLATRKLMAKLATFRRAE